MLILRGHFVGPRELVGIGAILGKRSARQICAGILTITLNLIYWLTKWEAGYHNNIIYSDFFNKLSKYFIKPYKI